MSLQQQSAAPRCHGPSRRPSVRVIFLAVYVASSALQFDVGSAVIEDDDAATHLQIQYNDGRTHYQLSSDLVRALEAVGLRLLQPRTDDVDRRLQSSFPANATGGGSGSSGPCVVLFGRAVVQESSAADTAYTLALFARSAADDVDVETALVRTVSMSFVQFSSKSRDVATRNKLVRPSGAVASSLHEHHEVKSACVHIAVCL
jgi:hypothetical protein